MVNIFIKFITNEVLVNLSINLIKSKLIRLINVYPWKNRLNQTKIYFARKE